jgi:tetratricopeptide (TPR) repeat protein
VLPDRLLEGIEAREAALAVWRSLGDRLKEGENLRWLSRLHYLVGHQQSAEETGHAAVTVLESLVPGPQLAWAYTNLAQLQMTADDDHDQAIAWGEKAVALAEPSAELEIVAHALNNIGCARIMSGDERGAADLERSLRLALDADMGEQAGRAYANLASSYIRTFRFTEADRYLEVGLAYTIQHDIDYLHLYLLGWQAIRLVFQGRWASATAVASAVLDHPHLSLVNRIQPLIALGSVRARRGEAGAAEVLDEALRLAQDRQRLGRVRAVRAEAAWLAGHYDRAREEASAGLALAGL